MGAEYRLPLIDELDQMLATPLPCPEMEKCSRARSVCLGSRAERDLVGCRELYLAGWIPDVPNYQLVGPITARTQDVEYRVVDEVFMGRLRYHPIPRGCAR